MLFFIFGFIFSLTQTPDTVDVESKIHRVNPYECWIGFTLKIPSPYHIYWSFPGSNGLPTSINWKLPEHIKIQEFYFEQPKQKNIDDEIFYIYTNEARVLYRLSSTEPLAENLDVDIEYLLCHDVCLPKKQTLNLSLDRLETFDYHIWHQEFMPQKDAIIQVENHGKNLYLQLIDYKLQPENMNFYATDNNTFEQIDKQTFKAEKSSHTLTLTLKDNWPHDKYLSGLIQIETKEGTKSFFVHEPVKPYKAIWHAIWIPLLFALLGGIFLNFMPCVLPILSIKILSLSKNFESPLKASLSYSTGVILTFLILGLIIIILRQLGHNIGWGFQLQSAYFVYTLCLLFLTISLNLFGWLDLKIPSFRIPFFNSQYLEAFSHGIITTLVATPCTAPYMGIALSYVIFKSPIIILLIFGLLGLGMSLPILLLTLLPNWIKKIPQSGAWMIQLKQLIGLICLLTLLWFIYILVNLTDLDSTFLIIGCFIMFTICIWGYRNKKNIFTLLLTPLPLIIGYLLVYQSDTGTNDLNYEHFNQERLNELIETKQPVLLTFTAKWCFTCLQNKKIILSPKVVEKLKQKNITIMVGDWTKQTSKISNILLKFGRQSIPFNVLIIGEEKIILPENLSTNKLLSVAENINNQNS